MSKTKKGISFYFITDNTLGLFALQVCVYLPSVHLPPPILYHLPPLFCVFCHAIFSTLAIRTSATPILKSESMQSIQQVGRRGHEGDDG